MEHRHFAGSVNGDRCAASWRSIARRSGIVVDAGRCRICGHGFGEITETEAAFMAVPRIYNAYGARAGVNHKESGTDVLSGRAVAQAAPLERKSLRGPRARYPSHAARALLCDGLFVRDRLVTGGG